VDLQMYCCPKLSSIWRRRLFLHRWNCSIHAIEDDYPNLSPVARGVIYSVTSDDSSDDGHNWKWYTDEGLNAS
jgi:hypothetical protein